MVSFEFDFQEGYVLQGKAVLQGFLCDLYLLFGIVTFSMGEKPHYLTAEYQFFCRVCSDVIHSALCRFPNSVLAMVHPFPSQETTPPTEILVLKLSFFSSPHAQREQG